MNDGRFIYDIKEYKNFSFEEGTLGSLPTDWIKLGNGDDSSTFEKSSAVAPPTISGRGLGVFVGEFNLIFTDTEFFASQAANPLANLNAEYIFLAVLMTAGGTGFGKLGIAGVDGGGTVRDAEVFFDFTGGLSSSVWTIVEKKFTFINPLTTNARVRIYDSDDSNALYADHTLFGKVIDLMPGGSEPGKLLNKFRPLRAPSVAISESDEAYETVEIEDAGRRIKFQILHLFNSLAIHDPIIDMIDNHLMKAEPVHFFFDKALLTPDHYHVAGANPDVEDRPDGVAQGEFRFDLRVLPWTGYK